MMEVTSPKHIMIPDYSKKIHCYRLLPIAIIVLLKLYSWNYL